MEETENLRKRKRQCSKELLQPPKGPGLCRSQDMYDTSVYDRSYLTLVAGMSMVYADHRNVICSLADGSLACETKLLDL